MKPWEHAKESVKRWGGTREDYMPIHDFLDSSKAHFPDMRHRALLHSSFGIFIAEKVFGTNIKLKPFTRVENGYDVTYHEKLVSVRDIAEAHVLQDMGTIPTVQDYLEGMPMYDWLGGKKREKVTIQLTGRTVFVD
jgi:hypothetical protein